MAPFQLTETASVPAPAALGDDRRRARRLPAPRRQVGPEVLHVLAERAVEQHVAGGVELGEVRQPAVADQPVAAGQAEGVALARGEQRFGRVDELFDEASPCARQFGLEQQAPRLLLLRRVRAVVEHRDQPAGLEFGVVLPVEARARPELEAGGSPPSRQRRRRCGCRRRRSSRCCARTAARRPAARGDRVDVDVVPRVAGFGRRVVGVGRRDVPERVPLPHHEAGLDVDLLRSPSR